MGKFTSFCAGVVIGGMAGAVTALLVTPKTGEQNRQMVADYASTVAQSAQEFGNNAYGQLQDGMRTIGNHSSEVLDNVKAASEKATAQFSSTNDELRSKIEAARDKIAEQVKKSTAGDTESIKVEE